MAKLKIRFMIYVVYMLDAIANGLDIGRTMHDKGESLYEDLNAALEELDGEPLKRGA